MPPQFISSVPAELAGRLGLMLHPSKGLGETSLALSASMEKWEA